MAFKFNPITSQLDIITSTSFLDSRYVDVAGDTMTGELDMQSNAIILKSSNGSRFKMTITNDGSLQTTEITGGTAEIGSPWLFLFGNI